MIIKVALLLWFVALALSFLARARGRIWMMRLFFGGFCLLLLGLLIELVSKLI